MKHVLLFLIGLLGLLSVTTLSAQNWNDTETTEANYFKNIERFYEQWKGDPEEKGKGWKVFKRWEWHWKNRVVLPEGRFPLPTALQAEWERYQKTHALPESKVAANWSSLGPFTSESGYGGIGRVNCVAFLPGNPDVLWAGAPAGGLWKSVNGGQTWTTNTDQLSVLGVSAIAIDPTNTNIMYIATGDGDAADTYSIGVLKSVDGGQSWAPTALSFQVTQLMRIRQLLIQPGAPNTLLAATTTGVFISKNAGASWTETVDGNFYDVKYKPDDPTVAYAATRDRIYKSTNSGSAWTLVKTIPTSGRLALAVTPANPNFLYALSSINDPNDADAYAGYNGLYISTDAGVNYTLQSSSPNLLNGSASGSGKGGQGWYDLCIAVDPLNANIVYVGGVNTWKSTNGGLTWTLKTHWTSGGGAGVTITHADKHCMAWQNNNTLFQGNDGGLYKTTNGGNNWTDLSNGLIISQMYTVGLSQSNSSILCGLQDNGTKGLIGGAWDDVGGGDGMECFINPVTPTVMYRSTQRGSLSRSTNGGVSWNGITPSGESGKGAWITPFTIDPSTPTTIYCAYKSVYKSTNQGTNWTKIGTKILADTNAVFTLLAIAPSNSNTIYAAVSKDIYRTTDGGVIWSKVTGNLPLSSTNITWVAVSPKDPNTVYITLGNYASGRKVFKSVTGGTTWANISGTLPNLPANTIVFQKDSKEALYVGMDVGVFYRDSAMTDWVPYNTGLPNVPVSDLEIRNSTGKLYAATYGRGLWTADVQKVTFAPTARFTATPTSGTAPLMVQFTDQSGNAPTTWLWDFGNGQQSTTQHPSFTYTEAGTYTVTLTVRNSAGVNTIVQTALIVVTAPVFVPTAQFTAAPTTGTAPLTVQFADQSGNAPTTWLWNFGNGQQSTAQHPSFTYTEAGTYTVTLAAGNSAGADTTVRTALIVVTAPVFVPAAQFTAAPTTGTAPLTVQFADQSGNAPTTWLWDFGNGQQSTAQHPSFTYTEAGTYTVTLAAGNSAGADTTVRTALIVVTAPVFVPTAQFTAAPTTGTAPLTVQFADQSGNAPTTWQWDFGNGQQSTAQHPSFTYTEAGTYTVTLAAGNSAGADTTVRTALIVVTAPVFVPTAQFTAAPTTGTAPLTVQFADQSGNAPTTWLWDFGNGQQSTAQHPSFTYTEAGTYTVTLAAGNSAGADTTVRTALIVVTAPVFVPTAQFTAAPTTGTAPLTVQFADQSGNAPTTWLWDFGNGQQSTAQHPSFTYTEAGTYTVTLAAGNSAGADTTVRTALIVVAAPVFVPTAQFTAAPTTGTAPLTVQFADQSGNAPTTWLWDFGNGQQSTAQHPSFTYTEAGAYTVTLTAGNSAGADTTVQTALIVVAAPVFVPIANFNGPNSCVDVGATVSFQDNSVNQPEQWYWAFPGGTPSASTLANPAVTYASPGTYDVELVVVNAAGADTLFKKNYLTIVGPLTIQSNTDTAVCKGSQVYFEVSGADQYVWNGPKGSATGAQLMPTVDEVGIFQYTVVGVLNNCLTPAQDFRLKVLPTPVLGIIPSATRICAGDSLTLSASGASQYYWSDTEGNQWTGASQTVLPTLVGDRVFYVVGQSNSGCQNSDSVRIQVLENQTMSVSIAETGCPGPSLSYIANVVNGGDQALIEWYKNGVKQGIGPNFILNGAVNGDEVYCTVTPDPENCVEPAFLTSNILRVNCLTSATATVGLEPILSHVAPNPTTGAFTVLVQTPQAFAATVSIVNPLGQCLETQVQLFQSGTQSLDFDLASHAAGMYWVKISGNGWVRATKVIKL